MNYRHAFHAGNFADCFKHALLVAVVDALARKPTPFFVLDTHAGAGRYDLSAMAARRTGEADSGIRRLLHSRSSELQRYLQLVRTLGLYPGSPLLTRALLRPNDRLACCELRAEEATSLRQEFLGDPRVIVHQRSGWEAVGALLPPNERRGLILIDPPFEDADEFSTLAGALARAHRRFANGTYLAWYPIKQPANVRRFITSVKDTTIPDILVTELYLREPTNPDRLNGCGLVAINPPFGFADQARSIGNAILDGLGDKEPGAMATVVRIADE